jgi:hypothetical protein
MYGVTAEVSSPVHLVLGLELLRVTMGCCEVRKASWLLGAVSVDSWSCLASYAQH